MITYTNTENAILNDIIKIAECFNVSKTVETSDKKLRVYYNYLGQGSAICQRINDLIDEKYAGQDYGLKMIPSELLVEFTLL